MLYFKSCLRCKDGTVELGADNFGSYLTCLTCGYTINSRSVRANGSIEEPMTLEDDVVAAPALNPVVAADAYVANPDSGPDPGKFSDDLGSDPELAVFEEELGELDIDIEESAAI
ncbi:MAG: hypothetical protein QF357_05010 [Dehalococcoidia bacterium]|jgi:hypothetical protein|nr:hypothetical protein [Dehalococcoidia bacterium]|tara:strand:- start:126 stop:470 length:345 start_codon:yes stop_codon:yes gene_type:complete